MPIDLIENFNSWDTTGDGIRNVLKELRKLSSYQEVTTLQVGLPEPVNGEIHVSGAYRIGGPQMLQENKIICDGDTYFIGQNAAGDFFHYTGTGAAINSNGHNFTSWVCSYITPNGSAWDMTGGEGKVFSALYNGIFNQAEPSKVNGFQSFTSIKLSRISNGAGFEFSGVTGKVGVFDCPFENITGVEIRTTADFEGLLAMNNNLFKDMGGNYIQCDSPENMRARITNNDFPDPEATNFVGFTEATSGFSVEVNTNQINSGVFLDAVFDGAIGVPVAITVGTEWVDIDLPYETEYAQRFVYDEATNSFHYLGKEHALILGFYDFIAEADANNSEFQIAIFGDMGSGFEQITRIYPMEFRQANDPKPVNIKDRIPIPPDSRFKARIKKPSGSSTITFITSKVAI